MALYRKHGVNPLGSCWMLLLQMPIFMGLYYALQESIHFRLASLAVDQQPGGPGHADSVGRQHPLHQPARGLRRVCSTWGRTSICCRSSP